VSNDTYLNLVSISKAFSGVRALDDVSFAIQAGDVHAIVGENGAGKSTLMKILAGVYPHGSFSGEFSVEGTECRFKNTLEAEAAGIVMIPQELAVVSELSVAENMFLNAWPTSLGTISWPTLYHRAKKMIEKLQIDVDPRIPIKKLGAAKQQLVLIAKALSKNVKILILDEPTSSLSDSEQEILFDRLRQLRDHGITSLYISHKLEEILAISERVTILRDGKVVGTWKTADVTREQIVRFMVGRSITQMYPRELRSPGPTALEVEELTLFHPDLKDTKVVDKASFSVRAHEIVGVYGLMGSGRTELMQGMFGAWSGKVECRSLKIAGEEVSISSPGQAMRYRLGLLPEDRKRSGIIEGASITANITAACLEKVSTGMVVSRERERALAEKLVRELNVRTRSIEAKIENLSGGNQQKVLVGRWLAAESKILLLDEPTRGIDVGAKVEIFQLLNRLAASGAAIVFVSSELLEVLGIADRILIMHEGQLQGSICWQEATEELVMQYATGHRRIQTAAEC
jgi:ABC-type sugar transport system ATPase subunit